MVAQGISEDWVYRKWNSGRAECWGFQSKSITSSSTWLGGNVFSTSFSLPSNFFTNVTEGNVNPKIGSGYAVPIYISVSKTSVSVDALANNSGTQTFSAHISVVGRWK